jgi:tetratricopeptide (TPR) repeat protein
VFAPLAEAYRKAGLVNEAIEIARDGLNRHPRFMGGRVALARALFDKKLYQDVIDELSPIVQDIPDNLVAQRLLAESYLILGSVAESLSAYKMLLYFSPLDHEVAKIVQELEAQAYEGGALVLRTDPVPLPSFDVLPAQNAIESDPGRKRTLRIKKIERLQNSLQKIERYKTLNSILLTDRKST